MRLAVTAEALGYDRVWVADSPVIWRELWVTLAAIASRTDRVGLGSAVTSGVTRHPAVTASAALSLAELAGDRFALGVGTGDSVPATIGSRPQTLAELRSTAETLRALLLGPGHDQSTPAGVRLRWGSARRVPLYIAASGPRMLELAGELADGVIIMVGATAERIRAAVARVRTGAVRAGRDPDAVERVLWVACAASDDAPEEAVAAVKANVARAAIRRLPLPVAERFAPDLARIRAAYDYGAHSDPRAAHAELVPDALVAEFSIAGTTAGCIERLRALAALDLDEITLAVPDAAFDDRASILARLTRLRG